MFVFIITAHSEDTGYTTSYLDNLMGDIEEFARIHLDDRLGYLNSENKRTYSIVRAELTDTHDVNVDQLLLQDDVPAVSVTLIDDKGHRPATLTYDAQGDVIVARDESEDDA